MNKWSKIYQWSLLVIAALIPSGLHDLALAAVVFSGICWFAQKRFATIRELRSEPQLLLPLLLYLYVCAGAIVAINHREAMSSLSVYFPLLFFPLFVGLSGIITDKLIKRIEYVFLFSTVLSLVIMIGYSIIDYLITGEKMVSIDKDNTYSKFTYFGLTRALGDFHPTYAAMFANHSIIILVRLIYDQYKQKKKHLMVAGIFLLGFLTIGIFLLNSMIAVLTLLLLVVYYGFIFLRLIGFNVMMRTAMAVVLMALSVGFLYYNPLRLEKLETLKTRKLVVTDNYTERNLLTMRLAKWDAHLTVIKRNFVFGTTEGDIKAIRKEVYLEKGYKDLALHNYNAHNQYIEIFADFGVIGFLIFAGMLIAGFMKKRSANFNLFMLIVMVTWLTESSWKLHQGFNYIMFFFVLYTAPQFIGGVCDAKDRKPAAT